MTTSVLAAFASRHQKVAAGLIVLSEFCNVAIGLIIGSSLLVNQPGWYLSLLLGGLVLLRLLFSRYIAIRLVDLVSVNRFRFQKTGYALLFLINFLAYVVAGGICGRGVIHPEPSISVSSESSSSFSSTSEKDSLAQLSPIRPERITIEEKPHSGTKTAYVLLFLASIPLFILSSRLACSLACSNQGFFAVFVFLLGVGILAGGFYFLGRVFDKNMKPYKDMTKSERKREGRRYGRTLLGTVLGIAVFALLPALFN